MSDKNPVVELKLPVIPDIELTATKTAEVISKHMDLSEEKTGEISMAIIESCINAFEHSKTKEIYIHFIVSDEKLTVKVIDKGQGFDKSKNYYVYCHSGVRSVQACQIMKTFGFNNLNNLIGGISEWKGLKTT